MILDCKKHWNKAWSKEYREMDDKKVVENVKKYMKDWMMLREKDGEICILAATGKQSGFYPNDYVEV